MYQMNLLILCMNTITDFHPKILHLSSLHLSYNNLQDNLFSEAISDLILEDFQWKKKHPNQTIGQSNQVLVAVHSWMASHRSSSPLIQPSPGEKINYNTFAFPFCAMQSKEGWTIIFVQTILIFLFLTCLSLIRIVVLVLFLCVIHP